MLTCNGASLTDRLKSTLAVRPRLVFCYFSHCKLLQAVEQHPSVDLIMQAVVQYNRKQLLSAAPASTAEAGPTARHPLLVVGYVMKASREEQLSSAGLLHLLPQDNMCFMPFDVTRLHEDQGHIDLLLHKGSDDLVATADGGVVWSDRLLKLQQWLGEQQHICVVDPFPNTRKVSYKAYASLFRTCARQKLDQSYNIFAPACSRSPLCCAMRSC